MDGMPFASCCTFAYVNSQGAAECFFKGLVSGSCERFLQLYTYEAGRSPYTAISNPLMSVDCDTDMCNDPMDPDYGCPTIVDEFPDITASSRSVDERVPELSEMLAGAPERTEDGPPIGIICVGLGGLVFL